MTRRTRGVVLAGLLVALLLAGFGSYYASSEPDGLARVAIDKGLDKGSDKGERDHGLGASPLAGYSLKGVAGERLSGGLAGVAGVALTFLLGGAIAVAVRRRGPGPGSDKHHAEQSIGGGGARS